MGALAVDVDSDSPLPRNRLDVFRWWDGGGDIGERTGTTTADRPLFSSVKSGLFSLLSLLLASPLTDGPGFSACSGVEHRTATGPWALVVGSEGSRRRNCSIAPCLVASSRRKDKGTGPWSRLVWSPTLTFSGSEPVRGPSERASERGSASIKRSWIPCLLPPSVLAGRHSAMSAWEKCPQEGFGGKRAKKTRRVARVLHTRAHGSLSFKVSWSASSSASARRGRAPGTGCGRGHGRSPASLSPRPKGKLLFCVGVDSSVDATLLGYTQRGGVCRRRAPDQREEVACSRR